MNVSMSEDSLVNSSRSKFFCPGAPLIIWDLQRKVFLRLGIALSAVIFPLYHRYFIAVKTTLLLAHMIKYTVILFTVLIQNPAIG